MKRFTCLTFILALAVSFAFAGASRQTDAVSGATPNAPQGKIVIYTSMYEDVIEALRWTVKRQFPNCAIEFVYGGTGQIQTRVAAETAAGKLGCDMLLVADPSYSLELKAKGMLHSYVSRSADFLAFDYDAEGYWYPVRVSNMVLAYNPEKTPKNSVPNSFRDFAFNQSVRGAVSMGNPLTSGTALAALSALRDKYGDGYFTALVEQSPVVESGAAALTKLQSGEYKMVMVLEESVLQKRQEEISKLEVIYPSDGTIMIPSTIMTVADKWSANNNTKTAEVITEWFLSPDGQNFIVDNWMHSVRKSFRRFPFDAIPTNHIQANTLPVNWENCLNQRDEIQGKIEAYLESGN